MSAREAILARIQSALGTTGIALTPPAARLTPASLTIEDRIELFRTNLEMLSGKVFIAPSREEAVQYVDSIIGSRSWLPTASKFLQECGIIGSVPEEQHRYTCATVEIGVTSADYALADPGTLVMLSEPRLASLLPPVHIAVIPRGNILNDMDELVTILDLPAQHSSSMVFITGPSRTGDIEQILVRGVHGPGELHVVIV